MRRSLPSIGLVACLVILGSIFAARATGGSDGAGPGGATTARPTTGPPSTAIVGTPAPRPPTTPVPTEACFTPIPLTPVDIRALPDGGTDYVYDTDGDGIGETRVPIPPADFDRLTATDQQIERYGLPPRPTDPESLARWRDTVGRGRNAGPGLAILPCISFR